MMRFQHLGLSLFVTVLALPSQALAAWGDDWGTMVWETAPVGVPTFGLFGLGLLSLALVAGAVFTLRKRAWTASVLLLVLAIPPAAVASSITNLNIFSNGTAADANEVNSNFTKVKTAVDDNDSRIGTALSDAATAQASADSAAIAASDEATTRAAADTSLQGAIDAEAASRMAADSTLQASIGTEATARTDGDAALDTRLGVVESGTFSSGIVVGGDVTVSDDVPYLYLEDNDAGFTHTVSASGSALYVGGSSDGASTVVFRNGGTGWDESVRITPAGDVGIGTPYPTEKLMVWGNMRVYGPTSGSPAGGVISAERGGSGAVVLDPTGSTSSYTATLSLDNTGFKVGHNSASRNIEFQTGNTTRMQIATNGDVDIEGDLTFGPSNTSLTTALASAGGGVAEINQDCAVNTGCFSGDGAGFPVTITSGGSYRLTSDLDAGSKGGFIISTGGVTLDLNGFRVSGDGTFADGIGVHSAPNVEIRNGSVEGFGRHGIFGLTTSPGGRFIDVRAIGNGSVGIRFESEGTLVRGCTAEGNVIGIDVRDGSLVLESIMGNNSSFGLYVAVGSGYGQNLLSDNNGGDANPQVNGAGSEIGFNVCGTDTICP